MVDNNNSNPQVSIASETRISRPVLEESLPVSWSDWDFVKDRITRCRVRLDIWGHATAFFLGIIPLAVTVRLSGALSDAWSNALMVVAVAAFLLALVCFGARSAIKRAQGESINIVLEDMGQIEKRYQRPPSDSVNTRQDRNGPRGGDA